MNKRGVYTSVIGIIILAIIGGTIFYLTNPVNEIKTANYTNAMMELNYEMQNARHLLDKAMADAIFDYVWENVDLSDCSFDTDNAKVGKYMGDAIKLIDDCKAANISLASANTAATVVVICEKEIKKWNEIDDKYEIEFKVHIEKTFDFSKGVKVDTGPGLPPNTCTIEVTDEQSGLVEASGTKS